jgi:hypothetical protein
MHLTLKSELSETDILVQKVFSCPKGELKIMITHLTRLLCPEVTLFTVMNCFFVCEFFLENTVLGEKGMFFSVIFFFPQKLE